MVGPSWVGDMVMAQCLFKTLRRQHPAARIDVLAPAWSLPLLSRMSEVTTAIEAPFKHRRLNLRHRFRIGRSLVDTGYQWSIVLPNSWKAALVPMFANIPRRTGYLGEQRWGLLNDIRRLNLDRTPMTAQRFVALAYAEDQTTSSTSSVPLPRLFVDRTHVKQSLVELDVRAPNRLLVLCPGSEFGDAKRWPEEYYSEIAQRMLRQGWSVWLMGSEYDTEAATRIQEQCQSRCVNLTGRTTLGQAIDLLSLANLVVSNDSGLMHIAAALDRPTVAIYGSTDPKMTPPISATSTVVSQGLPCSPCFKRRCPLGHLRCLREITPDHVLNSAAGLLDREADSGRPVAVSE